MRRDRRKGVRLKSYDDTRRGAYFITICTWHRESLFGEIANHRVELNSSGLILQATWNQLPRHYPHVGLDELVIIPNLLQGIIVLTAVGEGLKPASTRRHGLPDIVRAIKTYSLRRINALRGTTGAPVWQCNQFEHVIRNERKLDQIRAHIANNPLEWASDRENPAAVAQEADDPWRS